MRCVANYMKYFKSVDQFCLLNICRAREYNVPEIYNAFTIVNKKQLNELLNDYNDVYGMCETNLKMYKNKTDKLKQNLQNIKILDKGMSPYAYIEEIDSKYPDKE